MPASEHKPRTVTADQLTPGTAVIIEGVVTYSRVAKLIDGKDLELDKQRRNERGQTPINQPYTTIAIAEAKILPVNKDQGLSLEERYVEERFWKYVDDNSPNPWRYQPINKSKVLAPICQSTPEHPTMGDPVIMEGELAAGQKVILVMEVYVAKQYNRKAISLRAIFVPNPIRFASGDIRVSAAMRAAGVVIGATPIRVGGDAAPAEAAAPAYEEPAPAPAAAPAPPAPTADMLSSTPAAEPAQPAANMWTCPKCGNLVPNDMQFCGTCGTPRGNNPYASKPATSGGIRYDANQNDRAY